MPQHSEEPQANTASQRFSNQHQAPSIKYEEIEGPNPKLLYQARAPPNPVLPRKRLSAHNNVLLQTLRERYPLTASLTGPARAGKAGELSCAGGFYRGEVLAGQPHGKGQFFTMLLGGRGPRLQYDGQWWQGRREGKGTRFYFNGETYSGMWLANQRHGLGRMEYTNGDAYEGTWERDIRQGPATYFYGNGDIFVGRYVRDRREGLGTIYMPRKRQKHVAEYVADRPLCGSWAELDDAALAPLSGYLGAALAAAESVEAEMEHHQLPQLAIRSPNKMLGEQIDVLRKTAGGRAQLLHAVSAKMSTFEAAEVERLQHAFVRLGGGDARKARVTEDRLTEVCTAAGLQPGQERTLKLCSQLLEGVKQDGKLDFEDFISVVYFKEVDELLSAYGVHPDGHKD